MTIQEALKNLEALFGLLDERGHLSKFEKEIMNLTQDTVCGYVKATLDEE